MSVLEITRRAWKGLRRCVEARYKSVHAGRRPRAWMGYLTLALSVGWMTGCSTGGNLGGRGQLASLHLFAAPVALNLDPEPGPDAIGLRLYASGSTAARGVAVVNGTLELLMFDGLVSEAALESTPPRKSWKFSAQDLRPFATTNSLGVGYQLTLSWGTSAPRQSSVSVIARYRNPAGRVTYSTLNVISLTAK